MLPTPTRIQLYVGFVPAFVAVAVNVTDMFGQIVPDGLEVMVTVGGVPLGITYGIMGFDKAGLLMAQAQEDCSVQSTTSPVFKLELE